MKASADCIDLIKHFEGCKLAAYRCSAGVLTIGYGHTGADVSERMTITQELADNFLLRDIQRFENGVAKLGAFSQCQFDALVSFAFNLGLGNLQKSTLLKKFNAGDVKGAADEFLKWNRASGKILDGLTKRRIAERKLFLGESWQ